MRLWYLLKAIVRRLRFSEKTCPFKPYGNPEAVGGWLGWYEDRNGQVIAFVDTDNRIRFDW